VRFRSGRSARARAAVAEGDARTAAAVGIRRARRMAREGAFAGVRAAVGAAALEIRAASGTVIGARQADAAAVVGKRRAFAVGAIGVGRAVGSALELRGALADARHALTAVREARAAGSAVTGARAILGVRAEPIGAVAEKLTAARVAIRARRTGRPAAAEIRVVRLDAAAATTVGRRVEVAAVACFPALLAGGRAGGHRRADRNARVVEIRAAAGAAVRSRLARLFAALAAVGLDAGQAVAAGLALAARVLAHAQAGERARARAARRHLACLARAEARSLLERHAGVGGAVGRLGGPARQRRGTRREPRDADVALQLARGLRAAAGETIRAGVADAAAVRRGHAGRGRGADRGPRGAAARAARSGLSTPPRAAAPSLAGAGTSRSCTCSSVRARAPAGVIVV